MTSTYSVDYLQARGITSARSLHNALTQVVEGLPQVVMDAPSSLLSAAEQQVLEAGGLRLDIPQDRDPIAEGAAAFAVLVEQCLSADALAKRLGVTSGRVYQMLSDRDLFSFRLKNRRLIPAFQVKGKALIPNISQVNHALPTTMHPLAVSTWYHTPNAELTEDPDNAPSPLQWLAQGNDPAPVVALAGLL